MTTVAGCAGQRSAARPGLAPRAVDRLRRGGRQRARRWPTPSPRSLPDSSATGCSSCSPGCGTRKVTFAALRSPTPSWPRRVSPAWSWLQRRWPTRNGRLRSPPPTAPPTSWAPLCSASSPSARCPSSRPGRVAGYRGVARCRGRRRDRDGGGGRRAREREPGGRTADPRGRGRGGRRAFALALPLAAGRSWRVLLGVRGA